MISSVVYFDEIVEEIKDATGIENARPLYDRFKRFVFKIEQEIGGGGLIIRKKKSYIKGDGLYDGKTVIMPEDFVGEFSYGSLAIGDLTGNVLRLYSDGPAEIDLRYMGFILDQNGNPFTTRNHLNAIVAYAVYRLYSQKIFLKTGNLNVYRQYKGEYNDEVMGARGSDAFPTEEQWNALGKTMNGGAFEALTNCGMKGFSTGDNDPMFTESPISDATCMYTALINGESFGGSNVFGIIRELVTQNIIGIANGTTTIFGTAWDKDTLIGVANGSTTFDSALLTSPTEADAQIGQLVGSINGSSDSNSSTNSIVQIDVRTLGQTTITGTIVQEAQEYCYSGIYEYPDPIHPAGGSVTYIDQYGIEQTRGGIWAGDLISIIARVIISTTSVSPETCPPPPT